MSETHAILSFKEKDKESIKRIRLYLDETTRPSFEEEIPESEHTIFKAIEFAESPVEIQQQGNQLTAWFEFIDEDDILNMFNAFECLPGIGERYAFLADDEEYKTYLRYENGELKTVYTIEDDEVIDEKLWSLDWDEKALDWIIKNNLK